MNQNFVSLLRRAAAIGLLVAAGAASACEAQAPSANENGTVSSWVLSLNRKVSVAARCNAMAEAVGRMITAGSALRISILGYDKPEGSRSLSLAYLSAVTEELRSLLQQKVKGPVRIQTVLGSADDGAAVDPGAAGRIEIRVHTPEGTAGS